MLTAIVTEILSGDPLTRNSDNELILQVFERLGYEFTVEQKDAFSSMPNIASIIRVKARLQAAGRFRPAYHHKNTENR